MKTDHELIAEFLGWKLCDCGEGDIHYKYGKREYEVWFLNDLRKFEHSWDWLMPVVEKITEITYEDGDNAYFRTFGMLNGDGITMVRINRSFLAEGPTLINATYKACLDFIKHYTAP